jgi:imidazoleglycerol phosphate synthase glutamine amidotransferase subunit HisH
VLNAQVLDEHSEESFYNQSICQVLEEHLTAFPLEYVSLPKCGVNHANENHQSPLAIMLFSKHDY